MRPAKYHAQQFDHPFHPVKVADCVFDPSQQLDHRPAGGLLPLGYVHVPPEFAGDDFAVLARDVPRRVKQVAGLHAWGEQRWLAR